jgi:hypothetical protein
MNNKTIATIILGTITGILFIITSGLYVKNGFDKMVIGLIMLTMIMLLITLIIINQKEKIFNK